ncbi:unnamed protein product, partial [Mycena citricolor]
DLIQTDPGPRFVVTKQQNGDFLVLDRADAYAAYEDSARLLLVDLWMNWRPTKHGTRKSATWWPQWLELFDVAPSTLDPSRYTVTLHHLERSCELPVACLDDETFDLRQWYRRSFGPQAKDDIVRDEVGRPETPEEDRDLVHRMGRLKIGDEENSQGGVPPDCVGAFEERMALITACGVNAAVTTDKKPPPRSIGDLHAAGACALLHFLQPYTGDDRAPGIKDNRPAERFRVWRAGEDSYAVQDSWFSEVFSLPAQYLATETFRIGEWYDHQLASRLGMDARQTSSDLHEVEVEDLTQAGLDVYLRNLERIVDTDLSQLRVRVHTSQEHGIRQKRTEFDFLGWVRSSLLLDRHGQPRYKDAWVQRARDDNGLDSYAHFYALDHPGMTSREARLLLLLRNGEDLRRLACSGLFSTDLLELTRDFDAALSDLEYAQLRAPTEGELFVGGAQLPADQVVAKPLVVVVRVNGEPLRALIDSGSLGNLISTTVADQLQLTRLTLEDPITLQLAVQGSKSKINHCVTARFQYQDIDTQHSFYVANISGYDMILGTGWLSKHRKV